MHIPHPEVGIDWNAQSNQFTADGKSVIFNISIIQKDELSLNDYVENDPQGNSIKVVQSLPKTKNGETRNGNTQDGNTITILASKLFSDSVPHEGGHMLGLGHSTGLMQPSS